MKNKIESNHKISRITLFLIMVIMIIVSSNLNWGSKVWTNIIESDAKGYYAYLPATFIYHDLNFGFFDEMEGKKYYIEGLYFDYRNQSNSQVINKYYCGTAIAISPFFLMAHLFSYVFNFDMDGYSILYPIFVNLASVFYLMVGLLFLNRILRNLDISDAKRAFTLFTIVFGTHLFYYTVGEPGMSHIYSFAFMSIFIYSAQQYFKTAANKYLFVLGLVLGMIVLIRPINGIVVFSLPFLAGNFETLTEGFTNFFRNKLYTLLSFLLFLSVVFIQLLIYKISTGSYLVYSYAEEGFNFFDPHIMDMLFSYRKGLFLYTPVLFVSLAGGYFIWKKSRFQLIALALFFLGQTYLFSCWWQWYYGGSFSSRVYIEYIPFFAIPLGFLLKGIKSKIQLRVLVSILLLLIAVCQFQTFQYRHLDIHWSEMNKEKYWDVFLKASKYIK